MTEQGKRDRSSSRSILIRGSLTAATAAAEVLRDGGEAVRLAVGSGHSFVESSRHPTLEEAQAAGLARLTRSGKPPRWVGVYETMFGFVWRDDDTLRLTCGSPLVSYWDGDAWQPGR